MTLRGNAITTVVKDVNSTLYDHSPGRTHRFKSVHVPDKEGDVKERQKGIEELELQKKYLM